MGINDWVLVEVKFGKFCLGNIIALMKSNPGVIAKTILITEPFEGIYPLICEGSSLGHLDKFPYKVLLPLTFEGIYPLICGQSSHIKSFYHQIIPNMQCRSFI